MIVNAMEFSYLGVEICGKYTTSFFCYFVFNNFFFDYFYITFILIMDEWIAVKVI